MSHPSTPQSPDYGQQPGQYPPPGGVQAPPKKSRGKWALGCLGLLVAFLVVVAGCSALMGGGGGTADPAPAPETSAPADQPEETPDAVDPTPEQTEAPPVAEDVPTVAADAGQGGEQPSGTVSQQNAVRAAENYLDVSAFSRTGLIEQLEFEGYSTEDATAAVDSLDVDYNEQAAKAAQSYLDFTAFSRSGLIDQLVFDGYTPEQAAYGVAQTGL